MRTLKATVPTNDRELVQLLTLSLVVSRRPEVSANDCPKIGHSRRAANLNDRAGVETRVKSGRRKK